MVRGSSESDPHKPVRPQPEIEVLANEGLKEDPGAMEVEAGEAQEAKVRKPVYKPSPAEVEKHERTHLPWRPWCEACVAGMARDWPHGHRDVGQLEYPEMHFDY